MRLNKIPKNRKIWISSISVFILAIVVWVAVVYAGNDSDPQLGDSSPSLGLSSADDEAQPYGIDLYGDEEAEPVNIGSGVLVTEGGSLSTNDLKLNLFVPDKFVKLVMTDPNGTVITKTKTDDGLSRSLPAGNGEEVLAEESSEPSAEAAEATELLDLFADDTLVGQEPSQIPNSTGVVLGVSGQTPSDSPTITPFFTPPAGYYALVFDAPVSGNYSFDLYINDTDKQVTVNYYVSPADSLYPGIISLELLDAVNDTIPANFNLRKVIRVRVNYSPQVIGDIGSNTSEKLTIALPPGFTLRAPFPNASTGEYDYVKTTSILNEDFYQDDVSDILKTYMTGKNVIETLEFNFKEGTKGQQMSMDIYMQFANASIMNPLMVAYGDRPDQIPLRLTAVATSPEVSDNIDAFVISGTSAITNEAGTEEIWNVPYIRTGTTSISAAITFTDQIYITDTETRYDKTVYPISLAQYSYPASDINIYLPLPDVEGMTLSFTSGSLVTRSNGRKYWKKSYATSSVLSALQPGENYFISKLIEFVNVTPNESFEFGTVYIDYTHLGVRYEDVEGVSVGSIPAGPKQLLSMYAAYYNDSGYWGAGEGFNRQAQGTTKDVAQITLNNIPGYMYPHAPYRNVMGTYENAGIVYDFPYELRPTKIAYNVYPSALTKPTSVEYYVQGDPTPRTATVTAQTRTYDITFPSENDSVYIERVVMTLPSIKHNQGATSTIETLARETDITGTRLDEEVTVKLKISLTTSPDDVTGKDNHVTWLYGKDPSERMYDPIDFSIEEDIVLYTLVKADSLMFGTYANSPHTVEAYKETGEYFTIPTNRYSLRITDDYTKDYNDVKLDFSPLDTSSDSDKAGFSLIGGVRLYNLVPGKQVDQIVVTYVTNKTTKTATGKAADLIGTYIFVPFDLDEDEYVEDFSVDFGKLHSEHLYFYRYLPHLDTVVNGWAHFTSTATYADVHAILPMYKNQRYVYGDPVGNAITKTSNPILSFKTKAVFSTSSEAQYINTLGTPDARNSDKAYTEHTFNFFGKATAAMTQLSFSSPNTGVMGEPRQGNVIRRRIIIYLEDLYSQTGMNYEYQNIFYLTVHPDFEIRQFGNAGEYTQVYLEEVTTGITAGYTVYGFQKNSPETKRYLEADIAFYIKPTAATDTQLQMVREFRLNYRPFVDRYMYPGYENDYPYNTISLQSGASNIPSSNMPPVDDENVVILASRSVDWSYATVSVARDTFAGIHTDTTVNSVTVENGVFQDHRKNVLGLETYVGNTGGGNIANYKVHYTLPRKDGQTASKPENSLIIEQLDNDFSVYLDGEVVPSLQPGTNLPLTNFKVVYKNSVSGTTFTSPLTPAELKEVTDIFVYFDDVPTGVISVLKMPLYTDATKVGDDVDPIYSYVGVRSANDASETDWSMATTLTAPPFTFNSYTMNVKVGWDYYENGNIGSNLANIANIHATYKDSFGVEQQVEAPVSNIAAGNNLSVNADVHKIYVDIINPTNYMFTKDGFSTVATTNSDFPRMYSGGNILSKSELLVQPTDLIMGGSRNYDAALILKPKISSVPEVQVPVYDTRDITVSYQYINGAAINSYTKTKYTHIVNSIDDATIADVSTKTNDTILFAQGKKVGVTYFTYSLVNALGDEFPYLDSSNNPIKTKVTVLRSVVPNQTATKKFVTGSDILESTDVFPVKIWTDGTDPTTVTPVDLNKNISKSLGALLGRGEKHYIQEVSQEGYEFVRFEGTADGQALTFSPEATPGVYSFTIPSRADGANLTNTVDISVYNKNEIISLDLVKMMKSNPFLEQAGDTFDIKVTTQDGSTILKQDNLAPFASMTVNNLQYGVTYKITEVMPRPLTSLYELENITLVNSSGVQVGTQPTRPNASLNEYLFTVGKGHKDAEIVVLNKYPMGGGINLTKNLVPSVLAKEEYTFKLSSPNGFTAYGTVGTSSTYPANVVWRTQVSGGGTIISVDELPAGTYTLEETSTNINYEFKDMVVDSVAQNLATPSYTFTVTELSALRVVELHNQPKKLGEVVINKAFDASTIANDTFTFTLRDPLTGDEYTSSKAVTSASSGTLVFDTWTKGGINYTKIPLGEYQLSETSSGTSYKWLGFDNANIAANTLAGLSLDSTRELATFTLDNNASKTTKITLSGKNELKKGSIKINKYIQGSMAELPRTFKFKLFMMNTDGISWTQIDQTGAASIATIDLSYPVTNIAGPETLIIPNLPYGKYYIEELEDDYFVLDSGDAIEVGSTDTKTIKEIASETTPEEFNVYNNSKTAKKNFLVYKKLSNLVPNEATSFKFTLKDKLGAVIYNGEITIDDVNYASGGVKVVWTKVGTHDNGTLDMLNTEIKDLAYGTYTLTETDSGNAYEFDSVTSIGGLGQKVTNGLEFKVDRNNDDVNLTFHVNNNAKSIGSVNVTKQVVGGNTFPDTMFKFEITEQTSNAKYIGSTKAGGSITKWERPDGSTVDNGKLPLGKYVVTESSAPNFTLDKFDNVTPATSGTATTTNATLLLNSASKSVGVTAFNSPKTGGSITANKTFENNYNYNNASTFAFLVYGPEVDGVMPTTASRTINVTQAGNWSSSLTGTLPFGKYIVKEDLSSMPDYEFVSMSDGINPTSTVNELTFIVGEDISQTTSANISAINRVSSNGKITIRKEIEGENGNPDAEFAFAITDALGNEQTVTLKANEEKTFTGILFGDVKVVETEVENYNHTGSELNSGARVNSLTVNVPVTDPANTAKLVSFSKNKTDGNLTIKAELTEELKQETKVESLEFMLYRWIHNTQTWEPVVPKTRMTSVKLAIDDTYTYTDLLRGGQYKVAAVIEPTKIYQVSDILQDSDTIGTADVKAGTFEFQPEKQNLVSNITYMLDIKRIDLGIYKYFLGEPNNPAPDASFTLMRFVEDRPLFYAKDKIDINGNLTFEGLPAGKYVTSESYAPRGYVVLQSSIYFTITHNEQTGELDVNLTNSKYATYENGIISVPNDWRLRDASYGGDILDVNSLLNKEVAVESFTEEAPDVSSNKLPQAGGVPLSYISFAGLAIMLGGSALLWKEKRGKEKEE